jgi:hypothetical protein
MVVGFQALAEGSWFDVSSARCRSAQAFVLSTTSLIMMTQINLLNFSIGDILENVGLPSFFRILSGGV